MDDSKETGGEQQNRSPEPAPESKEQSTESLKELMRSSFKVYESLPPKTDEQGELQNDHTQLQLEHFSLNNAFLTIDSLDTKGKLQLSREVQEFSALATKCKEAYENLAYERLAKAINLEFIDPAQLREFIDSSFEDLPPVPGRRDRRFTAEQRKQLSDDYQEIEKQRQEFAKLFSTLVSVRNLQSLPAEAFEKYNWGQITDNYNNFLLDREFYERVVYTKKHPPSKFVAYTALLLGEMSEELVEEFPMLRLGRASSGTESFPGASIAERRTLTTGALEAQRAVQRAAPPVPGVAAETITYREYLRIIARSPLSKEFWMKLMKVESAATVMFWAYYLHNSEDKIKASLNFATFITGSKAISAGLDVIAMASKLQTVARHKWLAAALRTPGNFIVKFAVAIGALIGGYKYIDAMTSYVSEKIPDGVGKHQTNVGLSLIGGDPIFAAMGEFVGVRPEKDHFKYLSKETLSFGDWTKGWEHTHQLDFDFMHDAESWNDAVDSAYGNPVMKRLWSAQEKIDRRWVLRESLYLYSRYVHLQEKGKELQEAIVALRGENKTQEEALNIDDIRGVAVGDSIEDFRGAPRNDRQLEENIDDASTGAGMLKEYVDSLGDTPSHENVKNLWNEYIALAREMAKYVSVYRHLGGGYSYNQDQWLGKNGERPEWYQDSLAESIGYQIRRRQLLLYAGQMGRGEYGKYLGMSFLPAKETQTVLGVEVSSVKPFILARAVSKAAEAAGKYLPEEHDINILMAQLRDSVDSRKRVPKDEAILMRDAMTDAMRLHHESKDETEIERSSFGRDVVLLTPDIQGPVVYKGGRLDAERAMPALFKEAFENELIHDNGHLRVLQYVVPENGMAVLGLTTFHCDSADPAEWTVSINRHHISHQLGSSLTVDKTADRGHIDTRMPFDEWSREHPALAAKLADRFGKIQKEREAFMKKHGPAMERALEQAATSTEAFIPIPGLNEFRRKYKDATIILHEVPQVRTFSDNPREGNIGADPVRDYVFIVRREGQPDGRIAIAADSIGQLQKMSKEDQAMILDVITTPIYGAEGTFEAELAGVLNVFRQRRKAPSNFAYHILGSETRFFYKELLHGILPTYRQAENKRYFLRRLFEELDWRGGEINKSNSAHLIEWFKNNKEIFAKGSEEDIRNFDAGDRILGYPNKYGIYKVNKDSRREITPLSFRFRVGRGWEWSPGPDDSRNPEPSKWYSPHTVNVPWGKRIASPTDPNLQLLKRLQPYSKE